MKMLLLSVFFLLLTHVFSLNFSFTTFHQDDDRISLEKSARLVGTSIDLVTQYNDSVGRATYYNPIHLWDKATGKLTDFTTNFTFMIDSMGSFKYGDGMAFFLAPTDSKLPNIPKVEGAAMGLVVGGLKKMLNSTDHRFVAVEFDSHPNIGVDDDWDPPYVHVGVDIISIVLGVEGSFLVRGVVWFVMWKKKKKMEDDDECNEDASDDFVSGTGPKKYSYAELASAANCFSDEQKPGQGGFGVSTKVFSKIQTPMSP